MEVLWCHDDMIMCAEDKNLEGVHRYSLREKLNLKDCTMPSPEF